ncbi:alpha/beta hydrolase [Fructobacillus sp. W13]|uniref:Alpha/beta hydrolase n=1 Tax=Fructobacillus apis TaxID=2935017 RepID=A0ABT0ZQ87_9LACO|nr:alpha/beta hydrolase [Fructobacillus apis]MCO0832138.1 alpha/beta hydrolase [Fructobacillus apis]
MLFKDLDITFDDVFVSEAVSKSIKNQTYGPEKWQMFDLYLPKGVERHALILDLQGGGLVRGSKSTNKLRPNMKLVEEGFAVASMNYALISDANYAFPKQVAEVRAVLIQLKERAEEFGLDVDRFYLSGESSGAQLALLTVASATAGVKLGYEKGLKDDLEEMPVIQKVIASYGPYEFDQFEKQFNKAGVEPKYAESGSPKSFEGLAVGGLKVSEAPIQIAQGNPANYFTEKMPELFAMAGTADQVVPFEQSVEMVQRYEKMTGKKAMTHWIEGGHHGIKDFDTEEIKKEKLGFLRN